MKCRSKTPEESAISKIRFVQDPWNGAKQSELSNGMHLRNHSILIAVKAAIVAHKHRRRVTSPSGRDSNIKMQSGHGLRWIRGIELLSSRKLRGFRMK